MSTPTIESPPTGPESRHRSGGPSLTKLTVNITSKTVAALDQAVEVNDESKTDAANRAIQAYAFLTRMVSEGWELTLKDPDGREKAIQFL
jgi:hypothetical protein